MDNQATTQNEIKTKFCKHCGSKIPEDAVICTACGRQVEEINNANTNTATPKPSNQKNKWVAFLLCFFLGYLGAHRFYDRKYFTGILYLLTGGFFGIGWIIDTIAILFRPTIYYV